MPSGHYYRSPAEKKRIKECLALGRQPAARKKATAKIKKLAQTEEWKRKVSEGTKKGLYKPEVRVRHLESIAKYMKEHGPNFKGGNGQPLTKFVKKIASVLEPLGFKREFVAKTKGHKTGLKPPEHYKIDFAHPKRKVAIELDGPYHRRADQKAQDKKKEMVLTALGWTVIRITHD